MSCTPEVRIEAQTIQVVLENLDPPEIELENACIVTAQTVSPERVMVLEVPCQQGPQGPQGIQGIPGPTGPQGPPGTGGGGGNTIWTGENTSGLTIKAGQPVSPISTGVVLADATSGARPVLGLAMEDTANGFAVDAQETGPFTQDDWTPVTGTVQLFQGAYYYLSTVAGRLVTSPDNTPGTTFQVVGRAVSTTTLLIAIEFLGKA